MVAVTFQASKRNVQTFHEIVTILISPLLRRNEKSFLFQNSYEKSVHTFEEPGGNRIESSGEVTLYHNVIRVIQ